MILKNKKTMLADYAVYHPVAFVSGAILAVFVVVSIVYGARWNPGEKVYTGYIYAAEDGLLSTTGHIRFSQNAGEDVQPSFCVRKRNGNNIKKYVGADKKVVVTIPSGFAISFPWDCPIEAQVSELWEEER